MEIRWLFLFFIETCLVGTIMAQDNPILLFPNGVPGEIVKLVEKADRDGGKVGGETVLRLTNVSEPTITVYRAPDDVATGAAILVCPGGGYNILAYDLEGDEACEWLNNLGITAVLLKYRIPRREGLQKHEAPLQDAQRALGYIRAHAEEMDIDPLRIGVMGFSAGGHLAAMLSNSQKRTYPLVDAADKESCCPNFCLLVYPAYLDGENFQLSPELKISSETPPTMLIQAEDDKSYINSSLYYYYALKEMGVPVWMHLYSKGGHGYGLRDTGVAINEWPDRAEDWFRELGIIE
ncbi:alpha/beta hydrolase [Parabacteroides bouchesdurhonensis]|uniref:alpha/beta hydrolase n=1 Tax=Parabacteroides bouchesdurhonensis TaxID=1936995 RepID=UPI000E4ACC03|nr:alpha/beta hydrolase [Parabacteroides bouchesdurhonensis]RHJ95412.1 alpha/beta hydrolase [Bacteroides sp. AM07-16]